MTNNPGPRHVALILDGNRRFAKRLALQPWKGHELGKNKVEELLRWCKELGVLEATLYAFSLQNFKRAQEEVDVLMNLFLAGAEEYARSTDPDREKVRIRIIGRKQLLPQDVQRAVKALEEKTAKNKPYLLNIALAYGGREEITDAVKAIAREVKSGALDPDAIDEQAITAHLQLQSEPDMIIRTSGEKRTSNFLPWQSTYSEWFFTDKLWPEFTKEDFAACIEEYKTRERRYGGK